MKPATVAAKDLLRQSDVVKAVPKLMAEWEHNRFTPFVDPENPVVLTTPEDQDIEWDSVYDLASVALPNRPRTGIAKARFDQNGRLVAAGKYRDYPQQSRFYIPTQADKYKYWSSKQTTRLVDDGAGYTFETPVELTIMYATPVLANKVVVGFETSYAKPVNFSVSVTFNGAVWVPVTGGAQVQVDGKVTVWRDTNETWGPVQKTYNPTVLMTKDKIRGVRVTVNSMDKPASHVDVLQLGARLESDLSEFVEEYSRDFEIDDRSLIVPLGGCSSNTGSVNLDNIDGFFNNNNVKSPFYNLIGKKVKFTMDLTYDIRPKGSLTPVYEDLREFTMWTDNWGGEEETTATVELKDSSVFLQEISAPKVFWGNTPNDAYNGREAAAEDSMSVGAIIWQLMDISGQANYEYTRDELDNGQAVQYYWPDGDNTVWDEISDLAQGTQTAVYFDEYDVMHIKSRNAIFSNRETIDWNLDATRAGTKLPDIISLDINNNMVANQVEVKYKPAKYSAFNNGLPVMETVWEPEDDTVLLRATGLNLDLLKDSTSMKISADEAAFWPYECTVNIRGEILSYKGKSYLWTDKNGVKQNQWCYSAEDKAKMDDASDPLLAFRNTWGGYLKINERGLSGTAVSDHLVRPAKYNLKVSDHYNNGFYPVTAGTGMNYLNGVLTLSSPEYVTPSDYFLAQHETIIPSANAQYGCRMRFPSEQVFTNKLAVSGMFIAGDWGDAGYFIQLSPTDFIESENRVSRHELTLVTMPGDAPGANFAGVNGDIKGFKAALYYDTWIDLDINHEVHPDGSASITAYLNGVWAGAWLLPLAVRQRSSDNGKWGIFNTSRCRTDFEYIYAINLNNNNPDYNSPAPDQTTFLDLERGGFSSGFIEREWRYGYLSTVNYGPLHEGAYRFKQDWSFGDYVLDEFGPVVHEIREYDVSFDDDNVPVTHSFLYLSNDSQVVCTDYYADPFGAKFTLVNASRHNAIVNGEDDVTFGKDNSVDQKFFIYGRVLTQEDELTKVTQDKASIRKNGVNVVDFDSRFIQSEAAATDIGDWVVKLWAGGVDEIEADIFGNPFIQLGDLATLSYPIKDMLPATHKYFVVGIKNKFSQGLDTTLVLRRARI
jgi:hypothetical protein